jgi:hypothetical protein
MDRLTDILKLIRPVTRLSLCLSLSMSASAVASVLPVGQPEYDFLYERWLHQEALHPNSFDFQIGPYSIHQFNGPLGPFDPWLDGSNDKLHLFGFAAEDFRSARYSQATGYESLRAGVRGRPFERVGVYADFVLDEELAKDPFYSGKKWRGFAGDVDQAFASYEGNRFKMLVGRFGAFWGPQRSLIFSPQQKLDGLAYTVRWGRLAVSYRLGALDGLNPDEDPVAQFEPRYVAAHRFDWHFSNRLRAGLFETVVFGGPGRQIDLFYLNPLIFFHGSQLNEKLNDNTTVGFDFDTQPLSRLSLYGQLVLDDIQLDKKSQSDQEPDQYGLLFGGYLADLWTGTDIQFEYERVTNWTFNQMHERNRYLNDGHPIGSVLGNDYDFTSLKLIHWWRELLQSNFTFSYCRQGEGRVDAPWTQPWEESEGDYSEPFPTGVVEKTTTVALGLKGFLFNRAFVDLQAGVDWLRNRNHLAGDNPTLPFVKLCLSLFGFSRVGMN